jgi:hypothetical protein
MPDSKRQKIIDAVIARMQTIRTVNLYQTELGANVGDWQTFWDDGELPALSVCDTIAEEELIHDEPTATKQFNRLTLILKIFTREDVLEDRAKSLRTYIADVKKAINVDRFWTVSSEQLAAWTKPIRSGIVIEPDKMEIGSAAVEIEIGFYTESFSEF